MDRPPDTAHPRSEVIVRPGLAGGEIWRTKRQPVPFGLRTAVDCTSMLQGHQLYKQYQGLSRREGLVQVVYADVGSSAGLGTSYFVLDVLLLGIKKTLLHAGKAINPPSACILEVEWMLAPFDDNLNDYVIL